jgi:hypothetical protein
LSKHVLFIITLFAFFLPYQSAAHTDDISKAQLSINNSGEYTLNISVDILHLIKKQQVLMGDDEDVINVLRDYSFIEQKKLLNELQAYIAGDSSIIFDDISQPIANFSGLHLHTLKRIIDKSADLSDLTAHLQATGTIPTGSKTLNLQLSPLFGDVYLNVIRPEHSVITRGAKSAVIEITPRQQNSASWFAVVGQYLQQGFIHILPRGLDHILFVIALFLFAKRRSTLIWQVSVFTLAHTVTLALGIYNILVLPSVIVEPLIALSIVYVALENIIRGDRQVAKTRLPVIFLFGLLHGLGFASVLLSVGLPENQYLVSLIAFNVGVELGQLTVIALAFFCLAAFMKKSWYATKLVKPLNIAIAIIATYWLIERLL